VPSIITGLVIGASGESGVIVCTPPGGMLKLIVCAPEFAFTSRIACVNEPAPLSLVLVTVNVAAQAVGSSSPQRALNSTMQLSKADSLTAQLKRYAAGFLGWGVC
jgi:hypothetical protein